MTVLNAYPAYCLTCKSRQPANHGPRMRDGEGRWVCSCDDTTAQGPTTVEAPKVFVPSSYQAAIKVALETTQHHLAVAAVAGSGKTTTLAWLLTELQAGLGKCLFLAFNKAIAETLATRVPRSVRVQTLNSFGNSQLAYNLRAKAQDPDDGKMRRLAADLFPIESHPHEDAHRVMMAPLVVLAKLERATLASDPRRLAERYGVDLGEADLGLLWDAVPRLVARARETALNGYIDYDDQVLLPATEIGWTVEQFDTIFVDEAQDLNEAQIRLVLRAAGRKGRIVVVGDRYQAIYGFRGAGITAFDDVFASLKATDRGAIELPLSVSYRCPQVAARIVNEEGLLTDESGKTTTFMARDGAPEGIVDYLHEKKLVETLKVEVAKFDKGLPTYTLAVVCPRNAPLVRPCLMLLVDGIKATIRGRDIGAEIVRLVLRVNPGSHLGGSGGKRGKRSEGQQDVAVMLKALSKHCFAEIEKLRKCEKDAAADKVADQQMVIEAFAEACETVSAIVNKIETIFSDSTEGVVFSTAHRFKGQETKRLFLLEEWLMPWPTAKQAWERRQGLNLRYVALTRYMERLTYVFDDRHPLGPEGDDDGDTENYNDPADRGDAWEPPSEDEQSQLDAEAEAYEAARDDTIPPAPAATFDGQLPDRDGQLHDHDDTIATNRLAEILSKLPSLPSEGKGRGFVSPTLRDWQAIQELYAKAGCTTAISKPARWSQHAFDVSLPGVKVRCSTTVEGFGETMEKGKNAIDVVIVNDEGRPIGGLAKVLRTDAWQGRVVERINALLRKHARVGKGE